MRLIYNNVAETAAIAASTTTGALVADNMKTDYKSEVHRSTGTSVVYTLSWATNQIVGGVALPCTNLSSTATIQVQLYSDVAGNTQLADSTAIPACTNTPVTAWLTPNANLFQFGAVSKTSVWFDPQFSTVRNVKITLVDTNNPAGYIDCAKIVCGQYWQPLYNVSRQGLSFSVNDSTQVSRNNAGDLLVDRGFLFDELNFSLEVLADVDRNNLVKIMKNVGVNKSVFLNLFPNNLNDVNEQIYSIYGKRTNSAITYTFPGLSSHSMQITGW